MATVTVLAPVKGVSYAVRGGNVYTPDPVTGLITGVPIGQGSDYLDLLHSGCIVVSDIANIGTAATGVSAAEFGDAYRHVTLLTMNGATLPAIAGGASLGVGTLLYTLPAGAQIIKSSKVNVAITQTQGNINANTPVVGLGTVVASGAVSALSGTATFQNINVGKTAADCNGTPTEQAALATGSPFGLVTDVGGTKSIFFNAAAAWSASGDAGAKLSGTVALEWSFLP